MHFHRLAFTLLLGLLSCGQLQAQSVGGNLSPGQGAFLDLFKEARPWHTKNADGSGTFDTERAAEMPSDPDGWPLAVPFTVPGLPPQRPHTVIQSRGQGTYTLHTQGKGRIRFSADAGLIDPSSPFLRSVEFQAPGGTSSFALTFHTSNRQMVFVDLLESDPSDPLRRLQVLPPGISKTAAEANPFDPAYLDSIRHFSVLRFMDLGHINSSPLRSWDRRPTPTTFTQMTAGGLAHELMFDLANRARRPAWICIPHQADDLYVRELARLARERLAPDLKLFLEYSNETWNFAPAFQQSTYTVQQGELLGLTGHQFTARRSGEIFQIFEQEFGDAAAHRLVKVLASQAARIELTRFRLEAMLDPAINPGRVLPDAIAIAPYFGSAVANLIFDAGQSATVTVEEILDRAATSIRGEVAVWTSQHAELAAAHDVWLVNYESGQHLVGVGPAESDETLTEKLIAANRAPGMGTLYTEYLAQQKNLGVHLNLLFSHIATPSRFGSWGLLEDLAQPPTQAPKWAAFLACLTSNPPLNLPPRARAGNDFTLVNTSDAPVVSVALDATRSRDLDGQILLYQWSMDNNVIAQTPRAVANLPTGVHSISLQITDSAGAIATDTLLVTVAPSTASQTLLDLDFSGVNPSRTTPFRTTRTLGPNVDYSGLIAGPGVQPVDAQNQYSFWVAGQGSGEEQSLAQAIQTGDHLSFTLKSKAPAVLDIRGARLQLGLQRLSFHAPRFVSLIMRTANPEPAEFSFTSSRIESIEEDESITFTLPFLNTSPTNAVEFKLYFHGEQFHGHPLALTSLTLNGASIIPRPRLDLRATSSGLEFSWPDGSFDLVRTDSLRSPISWIPVSGPSRVENGRRMLLLAHPIAPGFFALRDP